MNSSSGSSDQKIAEDDSAVVFGVAGAVEERDVATASGFEERLAGGGICAKFGEVAAAEFGPAFDFVRVPVAQGVAGRNVL